MRNWRLVARLTLTTTAIYTHVSIKQLKAVHTLTHPGAKIYCSADPGVGGHAQRFTEETLEQLMGRYRERILTAFPIPGGRERVYVLSATRRPPPDRSRTAGDP